MFQFLLLISISAFSFQMSTIRAILEDDTGLSTVIVWYVSTSVAFALLGALSGNWCSWYAARQDQDDLFGRFNYWGVVQNFPSRPSVWLSVLLLLWGALSVYFMSCLGFFGQGWLSDVGTLRVLLTWLFTSGLACILRYTRWSQCLSEVLSLDGLRPVFHRRFPPSEILSMREAMRNAPNLFWEEYAALPDVQVTEANNRRFRERVLPYATGRGHGLQSLSVLVAVAAGLAAVVMGILSFLELFGGGTVVTEWWEEFFSVGRAR